MIDYFERSQLRIEHCGFDLNMQIHKIQEEVGEVAEAWIAANGFGKKAGQFTLDDVFDEICDVISSSIAAARMLDKAAGERFAAKMLKIEEKLGLEHK
jgi:NTP pyrophosphatase (non-canonical NTP hydrolase)